MSFTADGWDKIEDVNNNHGVDRSKSENKSMNHINKVLNDRAKKEEVRERMEKHQRHRLYK